MPYDPRHGSPYDRGRADAWYGRPRNPHYPTGSPCRMRQADLDAYEAGYQSQVYRKG